MSASKLQVKIGSDWSLAAFWRWWRQGLLAWLPARLRRALSGVTRQVVLEPGPEGLVLSRQRNGPASLERVAEWSWSELERELLRKRIRAEHPVHIVLRLAADQALVRSVTLPEAAAGRLRQVLGFEMDRLTPFTVGQLYYDVLPVEHYPEQRRIRVELTALPRPDVDHALAALAAVGVVPDVVDIAGCRVGLNLLPPEQRPRRGMLAARLYAALVSVSLMLVVAAILLPLWQQRTLVTTLQKQVETLQRQGGQVLALQERLEKSIESSRFLLQKKRSRPSLIEVLRELTAVVPDSAWLERLQVRNDTLQIIGQAANASIMIGLIENSKLFSGAAFASPVTNDRRSGKERFVLGARIAPEQP